jgi:probable biosynthetic protein (TIGR04099 family)
MNIPLGMLEIDRILGGGPAAPAWSGHIVLGMPHLCPGGLSETWLLRECGHRHWFLLAQAAGRPVPEFRDAEGDPIYAAFVSVSVRDAQFDEAREHDELEFDSQLWRVSRTRFVSIHRLWLRGRPVGDVLMTSVFVKRMESGLNRSIARVEVPRLPPIEVAPKFATHAEMVTTLRSGQWKEHLGFTRADAAVLARLIVDPCPTQDFNGADLLYFSSFQTFVDRAEWEFLRPLNPRATTRHRDIVYHGNVEVGERVAVVLRAARREPAAVGHWCLIERESDVEPLADIFTIRRV